MAVSEDPTKRLAHAYRVKDRSYGALLPVERSGLIILAKYQAIRRPPNQPIRAH